MEAIGGTNGLWKGNLKATWRELQGPAKVGVIAVALVVSLVFVLRVLPYLVAAMGIGLLVALLFIPYWIPTIVAFARKNPSKGAIFALNFFFGWTFVGWVVALVWALSSGQAQQQVVMVNTTVVAGNSMHGSPQVGDVVDGRRYNGVSWVPVSAHAAPAAAIAAPQYSVGDVVNGHRFDGSSWVPTQKQALPGQPQPPGVPPSGSEV